MRLSASLSATGWNNGAPPIISGFTYPMNTLTASRAGQWTIDGVPVVGETGSTFVVPLLAYGRTITCDNSAPVTVWKPWDIAGVVSVRVADRGVLRGVSPDVVATNGQEVRRWNGLVSNQPADQTNSTFQPLWRATGQSGNPSLEFDGVDDRLTAAGNELDVFRNVQNGYIIAGCRDTNRAGGSGDHPIFVATTANNDAQTRLALFTRISATNSFSAGARRLDTDSFINASTTSNSDYNVLTAWGNYVDGSIILRVNGAQAAATPLASSGSTSNTSSVSVRLGQLGTGAFPGHITCVILANQLLSATDRSRLERFAGLFGGLNIPLV